MVGEERSPSLLVSQKGHDEDIFTDLYGLWTGDPSSDETFEIAHLLFRPQAYHFARVPTAVSSSKAELACDVAISVLENKDRGFVYFEGEVLSLRRRRMMHICLNLIPSILIERGIRTVYHVPPSLC